MKKYIYLACAMLTAAFTSCSNNDIVSGEDGNPMQPVIVQVTADAGLSTRAAATGVNRFAIEVYTDADYTTPAPVFADSKSTATNADGAFAMTLDKTQEYYCLLWADKDGATIYDLASLKAVTLKAGTTPAEAWQGTLKIEKGTAAALSATLTRAVAKITLLENKELASGASIALTFKQKTTFDVSKGETTASEADRTETILTTADLNGTTTPAKVNPTDIFVLASATEADMPTLSFLLTGSAEKVEVSSVPLKANFNTNIKGHYTKQQAATFTIICDNDWEGPDNDNEFPEAPKFIEVNGIKVATGNLVADGVNGAKIGKPTDRGLYFQFGSLIGWSETGDPATIAVMPATCIVTSWNSSWKGANDPSMDPNANDETNGTGDPCRYYLGDTWRLPTGLEFHQLCPPYEEYTTGWTWTGSSVLLSSGLEFPITGMRGRIDGELGTISPKGNYWTSNNDGPDHACYGFFDESHMSAGYTHYRGSAFPVRCVRD